MWIKIILVLGIIVIGVLLARPASGDRHLALRRLFMVFLVAVAIVAVLLPDWLTWLAHLIGVGRGTDLLLYVLVIAFLVFVSTTFRRNVVLDRKIALLTRAVTLAEARAEDAEQNQLNVKAPTDDSASSGSA
ncbi:DUF2304 domain-containing protein [Humibacter sp. RRB41]|uniref:DUF2304 domain-containing protein n=1 Tax=Humibacter sp. RRB41 TaxID=2919946 RepID=UPI001FAA3C7B|nr:DUF2304 domain-containing protein [Humibacter sp. RRB41]